MHISRAFLEHVGTRRERAIKALTAMGPPVFNAAFSTFLGIIVLAGAKSYIFQTLFKGFLVLIIIGVLHGLILTPVVLSLIGPRSIYENQDEKDSAEQALEDRILADAKDVNEDGEDEGVVGADEGVAKV